jgi:hypothetical protein
MDDLNKLCTEFYKFVKSELHKINQQYEKYKTEKNKRLQIDFLKKYPHLKTTRKSKLPDFDEILEWQSTKDMFKDSYNDLKTFNILKITGIWKHGQTDKTWLCNLRIISSVKNKRLTIAITKNTLDSKNQWEARLIKTLKEEYPNTPLKDLILIISSKKNDLNGNATHCKTVAEAIKAYTSSKNFKIIFVCSNATRIKDIIAFLDSYDNMSNEKQLPIEIQHDEAHNIEDGIPSKRELIEHILINPHVESYIPVSASNKSIAKEDSSLWKLNNLEANGIDYTKHSKVISTSDDYSSIADANHMYFEDIKTHSKFTEYNIKQFDEETFDEAEEPGYYDGWTDEEEIKKDKDRRRKLEPCRFMAMENDACNIGMNLLDNYYTVKYKEDDGTVIITPLILEGTRNIHLITTPMRVVLTIHLIKYALKQKYSPICIGLYRSGIHLRYKDKLGRFINKPFGEISESCSGEQMNDKIYSALEYLKTQGESLERPIIIMGNDKVTSESITFVHYKYGTLRTDTVLPSIKQTRESNYQAFLRSCYIDKKFREHDPEFKHPPKWIIGTKQSITDACVYERENDERISRLENGVSNPLIIDPPSKRNGGGNDNTGISTPCKITILDTDDEACCSLRVIIRKENKSEEEKRQVLCLIQQLVESSSAQINDPTGKFSNNMEKYVLKDIRRWKEPSPEKKKKREDENRKPYEANYRFREYDSHHQLGQPYINDKSKMKKFDCELLAAYDKYVYDGFVNQKSVMWLSYKYE